MSRNVKTLLAVIGGAILLLLVIAAFAGAMTIGSMMRGMGSMMNDGMSGGGVFGMLFMLFFWGFAISLLAVLLVTLVVWIVNRIQRR